MCGIYGFYSKRVKEPQNILKKMGEKLLHRGPDSQGEYSSNNFYLGHRRLSIIDLKSGDQPIFNEDKSISIIFNGEIYNFLELKETLIKKGHKFYTQTDTEVMVHLYEEYGEDMLNLLNGQFAFCIFDEKKHKLFLARDRMGQKPLYYYFDNGNFIFASEIKAILEFPNIDKSIDYKALTIFLKHQFIPGDLTSFNKIKKLPPANKMIFQDNKITIKKYWQPEFQVENIPYKTAKKHIEELLYNSVKLRKIADVKIGSFLSGGIDSSLLTAMYAQIMDKPINTFTVDFQEKGFSEKKFANLTAKKYQTNHKVLNVNISDLNELDKILSYFDEPFGDYSLIPTYYLTKAVSKDIKVAISGDGGDELFGGYERYKYFLKINCICPFAKLLGHEKLNYYCKLNKHERYMRFISIFKPEELKTFVNKTYLTESNYFFPENKDIKYDIMANDMFFYLPEDGLVKVDRMAMANSIEVRNPFLDHNLVEYSLKLPSKYKFNLLKTKIILRDLSKKYLPNKIVKGKKRGFNPPLISWYNDKKYYDSVRSKILHSKLLNTDFLNKKEIENFLSKPINYPMVHRVFLLHSLSVWYENYGK